MSENNTENIEASNVSPWKKRLLILLFALSLQALTVYLCVYIESNYYWWNSNLNMPLYYRSIAFGMLLWAAYPPARMGYSSTWILGLAVALLFIGFLIFLTFYFKRKKVKWRWLALLNILPMFVYCIISSIIRLYLPVPLPIKTSYIEDTAEIDEFYETYETSYRGGEIGYGSSWCFGGHHGHQMGQDAGRETLMLIFGRRSLSPLIKAVLLGDEEKVSKLLKDGADINFKDGANRMALHRLFGEGPANYEMAKLLVDAGIDVNIKTIESWGSYTALHSAASKAKTKVIKLLLDSGANIDSKSSSGRTPLTNAVVHNKLSTVKLLIERGANVNSEDEDNNTPIFDSIRFNHEEVFDLLVAKGADIHHLNLEKQTLLQYLYTDYRFYDKNSQVNFSKKLLRHNINVNQKDIYGETALDIVLDKYYNDSEEEINLTKLLLKHGASINLKSNRFKDGVPAWLTEILKNKFNH